MFFDLDTFLLDAAQALCIALPAAGLPLWLSRLRGRAWALLAPLSLAGTLLAILLIPTSADFFSWVALLLVPPGCALALGWAMHGARPWFAVLAIPLLVAALVAPEETVGRAARILLIVGSTATAGRLLAGGAPLPWLKVGVIAMAVIDAIFVLGDHFNDQFAGFDAAAPAAGLPQLQLARIGDVATDYGDYFVAGLVGAIIAAERGPQLAAAILMLPVAEAWNQLFLVTDSLPNTTPPALVLIGVEIWRRRRRVIVGA
ncbi:MAG TPA: hypothetical protein VFX51_11150 [Solirubrobacteraceae bacterium]|nr:hypothetical protein [Solirubrobacteraceae bacterium]